MSYRVFARKYRPQTFEQVVGQEHITRTLQNAIANDRLAQAYLFVGPRGIGKTSTARILAKALNCVTGPTISPCGECDACREIAEGNSLDVLEIDGASNNSVDHVRELRENAAFAPARGPYKIYLIDEVHMLSTPAFNALLKTLEEPPPHVKFIFATTEAQKVPATITSRCQRFDLRRIPDALISAHLQAIAKNENIELTDDAAATVARGADGGLRDAESMLDQLVAFCGEKITGDDVLTVFGFTSRETVEALAGTILARDASAALALVAGQADAGKDIGTLLSDLIAHLRDLLVSEYETSSEVSELRREKLLMLLDHFAETEQKIRWASRKRLVLDVAIVKATHLVGEASLSDVVEMLTAIGEGRAPKKPELAAPVISSKKPDAVFNAPQPATPPRTVPLPTMPTDRVVEVPRPEIPAEPKVQAEPVTGLDSVLDLVAEPKVESESACEAGLPIEEPAGSGDREVVDASDAVVPTESKPEEPEFQLDEVSKAMPGDATKNWHDLWVASASQLAAGSILRFGWLEHGVFESIDDKRVVIKFPASFEEKTGDFFWDDVQKEANSQLSKAGGQPVEISFKFCESVAEPPPELDEVLESEREEALRSEPEPAAEKPAPPPEENYLDDPLIQKALKIFEATYEPKIPS